MGTPATTPDNPFDIPLPSEVQEHQQTSAATVASGGNPFDEPLPSEKAEAQVKANPEQAASNARQSMVAGMTGLPTPNMTPQDREQFAEGKAAGALTVPAVAGAMTTGPLLEAIGGHLSTIKSIIDAATKVGIGTMTYREAKELYKEFVGKK